MTRNTDDLTEEIYQLLGPRQPAEVAVNDNAVEAVVDEREQVPKQLGEQFLGPPHEARSGTTSHQAWTGQADREGKSCRLADEVPYIQRRAAPHNGHIVTFGQLVLFSTETGDAWLLDPADRLAARLA